MKNELVLFDRSPKLPDEREATRTVLVLMGRIDLEAPVLFLCNVHCNVSALNEGVDVIAVLGKEGDTDARVDIQGQFLEGKGLLEHLKQLLRNWGPGRTGVQRRQKNRKLITA